MLAYKLACDTDVFAAVAPVSATQLGDCASPDRVSLIHIHGTADKTVPYDGGPGRLDNGGRGRRPVDIDGPPVPELLDRWRRIDGCGAPDVTTEGPVTTSVAGCPEGRAVELVTIAGAGHQWPGGEPQGAGSRVLQLDPPSRAIDATETIWQFFADHPQS
jgi:polyhydroxybutyrate depolymerase